jgi:hypothetical protein
MVYKKLDISRRVTIQPPISIHRLSSPSLEVEKKAFRLGRAGYALCHVLCENCLTALIFQLYLYPGKDTGHPLRLYRIPGLGCRNFYRNGVVYVISDKKIVGRMLYGAPACRCDVREIVEIE